MIGHSSRPVTLFAGPLSILCLALVLPLGNARVVTRRDEYCTDSVCEYNFRYEKVLSMTWHEPSTTGFPINTRVWENENCSYYTLASLFPGLPGGPSPVDEADFYEHSVNVLDGRRRMLPSINGLVPAPTIEVDADARIIVHLDNADIGGQSVSIHWHGMFQVGTPFYDGIGGISQCHTLPGTSFTYDFTANPWGTFWYHAHTGMERTDGVYGALIVHDRIDPHEGTYDFDHFFTFVTEWYKHDSLEYILQFDSGGYFDESQSPYTGYSMAGNLANTADLPFEGGLFNDRGQHFDNDVAGARRFHRYDVQQRYRYRFRFICAAYLYGFRISIDGHKMSLISADGFDVAPVEELDSINIWTGERLDVIVEMDQPISNYWVRATTMEGDEAHRYEIKAVLHYEGAPDPKDELPITKSRACTASQPCRRTPCTWDGTSENDIECVPTAEWKNVDSYPDRRVLQKDRSFEDFYGVYPAKVPPFSNRVIFKNFGVSNQVDGISYQMNSHPMLFNGSSVDKGKECELNADGDPYCADRGCSCNYMLHLERGSVVDVVYFDLFSAPPAGIYFSGNHIHPVHVHGHAFYVLAEGLPKYNNETGRYDVPEGIACDEFSCGSGSVRWADGFEPQLNLVNPPRRDMYALAPGGWVYTRMVMDNPGNWAVHCHLETHTASMIYTMFVPHSGDPEDPTNFDAHKPKNFPTCGNFNPFDEEA